MIYMNEYSLINFFMETQITSDNRGEAERLFASCY